MTAQSLHRSITNRLSAIHPQREAETLAFWLLEHFYGVNRTAVILDRELDSSSKIQEELEESLIRLEKGEPIQYVLGEAHFYGHDFKVRSGCLIPRPETEELVDRIVQEFQGKAPTILDIGTGSGCIPISLKLALPNAKVSTVDISTIALAIARENATHLGAEVTFHQTDILDEGFEISEQFDVVVSNPPYVLEEEKAEMEGHVLDHEPHLALFVPNEKPLLFYERIADFTKKHLKAGGVLFFEINEAFGEQTKAMLEARGYSDVCIIQDLQGKDRMVRGLWG